MKTRHPPSAPIKQTVQRSLGQRIPLRYPAFLLLVFVIAIGVIINIGVVAFDRRIHLQQPHSRSTTGPPSQCGLQHPTDAARRACVLNSLDMQTNKPIYQLPR